MQLFWIATQTRDRRTQDLCETNSVFLCAILSQKTGT